MEIKHHIHIPGTSTLSPCSKWLRVKSVGWYLGFCQNQLQLRFTTSAMRTSLCESFIRDTWMRLPSWSISRTKLAVALENMASADEDCRQLEQRQRRLRPQFDLILEEQRREMLLFKPLPVISSWYSPLFSPCDKVHPRLSVCLRSWCNLTRLWVGNDSLD